MGVPVEDMVAELRPYVSGAADFTIEDVLRRTMDEFYTESRSWLSVTRTVWPSGCYDWVLAVHGVAVADDYVWYARKRATEPCAVGAALNYEEPAFSADAQFLDAEQHGTRTNVPGGDFADFKSWDGFDATRWEDRLYWGVYSTPGAVPDRSGTPTSLQAPDGSVLDGAQVAAVLWAGLMDDAGEYVESVLTEAATLDSAAVRKARSRGAPRYFAQHDGRVALDPMPATAVNIMLGCALKPTPAASEIPDDAMGTSKTYIVEGALAYLCRMPNQAWTSQAASEKYMMRFKNGIAEARGEAQRKWSPDVSTDTLARGSFDMYRKPGT